MPGKENKEKKRLAPALSRQSLDSMGSYFSDTRAIVAREAAGDLVGCWGDIPEPLAIELLGLGPHASYG